MKKTRVVLTVDTEPSIAGALRDAERYPPLLDEPVWGNIAGQSEALGFIINTLLDHELRATFFVETVHTCYFGTERMGLVAGHLAKAQQDLQLHLHPVWLNFRAGIKPPTSGSFNDDSTALDEALLQSLINEGCAQIEAWTGSRPRALRTGNFNANRAIYRTIAASDIKLTSNICVGSKRYDDPILNQPGGIHWVENVCEIPTTCFLPGSVRWAAKHRPMQITACSDGEMIAALNKASAQSTDIVVLTTHPFEFIKKADFRYRGLRPNRLVQRRLRKLCGFLAANTDRFQVMTFGDLAKAGPCAAASAPQLESSIVRSAVRSLANAANDRL